MFQTALLLAAAALAAPAAHAGIQALSLPVVGPADPACNYKSPCCNYPTDPYAGKSGCFGAPLAGVLNAANLLVFGNTTGGVYQDMANLWSPRCEKECAKLVAAVDDPKSAWHCDEKGFLKLFQCLSGNMTRCAPAVFCNYNTQGTYCEYNIQLQKISNVCCTAKAAAAGQCKWFAGASASNPPPVKPPPPTASRQNPTTGTGLAFTTSQSAAFAAACSGSYLQKIEWFLNGAPVRATAVGGPSAQDGWSKMLLPGPFTVKAVCTDYVDQTAEVSWVGAVTAVAPTAPAPPTGYAPTGPTAPSGPAGPSGAPTAPTLSGGPASPFVPSGPPQPQTLQAQWPGFRQEVHGVGRGEALAVQNNCGANAAASIASWAKDQARKKSGKTVCQIVNMAALKGKVSGRIGTHSCSNHRGRTHCRAQCYILGMDLPVTYLCQ